MSRQIDTQKKHGCLLPSDPRCLAPQLARVNTGPCSEDDPRRVEAREQHARYAWAAPIGDALDDLEARKLSGEVSVIRQVSPGSYLYCVGAEAFEVSSSGVRRASR